MVSKNYVISETKTSPTSNTSHLLSEHLAAWLHDQKPNLKESTQSLYLRHINNHICPCIGKIYLAQLTDEHIAALVEMKSMLAPKTLRSIIGIVNSALSYAKKLNLIESNPCSHIKLPKLHRNNIEVFNKAEQQKIEKVCDIGIWLCLYTGIRIGELCALQWRDIDLDYGMLHVSKTLQRINDTSGVTRTKIIVTSPKTETSDRYIPLPKIILDKLQPLRQEADDFIVHIKGKPIEPRTYQYRFQKLLENLSLEKRRFHVLRHTFAVRALEVGFDIKTLSEVLGHNDANVTLRIYAHTTDTHKRAQMDLLSQLHL